MENNRSTWSKWSRWWHLRSHHGGWRRCLPTKHGVFSYDMASDVLWEREATPSYRKKSAHGSWRAELGVRRWLHLQPGWHRPALVWVVTPYPPCRRVSCHLLSQEEEPLAMPGGRCNFLMTKPFVPALPAGM